jgi:TPP-dependent indolepyruvate ferredoxin oxidoreductase alpha subunit
MTTLQPVSLDDKYDLGQSRVFVTGYQALIRLCLMQKERDRRAGLNTAGYVTGYRGSPLGGLDQQFVRAARQIASADIRFQPGINEELAATALNCAAKASSMAYSACGTARARASIAPATCSATPIFPAPPRTAACWR